MSHFCFTELLLSHLSYLLQMSLTWQECCLHHLAIPGIWSTKCGVLHSQLILRSTYRAVERCPIGRGHLSVHITMRGCDFSCKTKSFSYENEANLPTFTHSKQLFGYESKISLQVLITKHLPVVMCCAIV